MNTKGNGITKQHIVEAAIEVFGQREFQEATMRDIAKKLGISQGNIYQYFESKESIILYILTEQIVELKKSTQEQLLGIRGTHDKLRKFAWHYLKWHEDHRDISWIEYISINVKAWADAAPVWDLSLEVIGLFGKILREGIQNGEVRPDVNIRLAGHMYIGALRSTTIFWLVGKQFKHLTEEVADTIADYTYEFIRVPELKLECPFVKNGKMPALTRGKHRETGKKLL